MHLLPLFAGLAAALSIQPRQSLPTGVKIDEITYSGTGCAASTIAGTGTALTDVQHFPVPQKNFRAETGANNTAVALTLRNCVVSVKVSHPAGWQFALAKVDFYGRVYVPQGVECTSRSNYTFAGGSAQVCLFPLSLSLHSSFLQVVWLFLLFVILETKEENKKEKKKRRRNQPKKKAERRRKKKEKQDG